MIDLSARTPLPDGSYLFCSCGVTPDGRNFYDAMGLILDLYGIPVPEPAPHEHVFKPGFKVSA